jgi:anaerobic selenocysteine-containing dehydrogenase
MAGHEEVQPVAVSESATVTQGLSRRAVSRRAMLQGAAGAGAVGLAGAALFGGPAAVAAAATRRTATKRRDLGSSAESADAAQSVVVHVRDLRTGEIDVFRGTSHTRIHDRDLASRLVRASH